MQELNFRLKTLTFGGNNKEEEEENSSKISNKNKNNALDPRV